MELLFISLAILVLIAYFLPAVIASRRSHPNSTAITLLNLTLGWTGIIWIALVIWACSSVPAQEG
jgi:hypothetical protein